MQGRQIHPYAPAGKGLNNMKKLLSILLTLAMLLCLAPYAAAETPEFAIPFRFASKAEGTQLLLANKEYYAKFSPNKLDYVMQKTGADMDGPEHKGYHNPEIIEGIIDILSK